MAAPKFSSKTTEEKLKRIDREAEERDAKKRAEASGYVYLDARTAPVQIDALGLIPENEAKEARIAPIAQKKDTVIIAAYNPDDAKTKKALASLPEKNLKAEFRITSLSGLRHLWDYYTYIKKAQTEIIGKVEIDAERLKELTAAITSLAAANKALADAIQSKATITQVIEVLLATALALKGSDIHFEAEEQGVRFRLRIDGLLHDVFRGLSQKDYFFVLSRVKLLSEMKLNVHDSSQDGRFTIGIGEKEIEIRASVLPSEYGETAVLRILDPETVRLNLTDLGLREDDLEILKEELSKPNGMILNTGPTGSGKTTTLYAFLMHANKPEIKIITLEDPIEYRIPDIEQTQVNKEAGYTFANGLRSIVRQDPDVILVGEIRDLETADIALNAALTGHLVFSTLHTNDSFGAIPRLIDLGTKAAIVGPALNVVIAQRLVRRLCPKCKVSAKLTAEEQKNITNFFKKLPARVNRDAYKTLAVHKPKPKATCEVCGGIGYKGRIAVMELLRITDIIGHLISKKVTEMEIKKAAEPQGVVTVQQAGILKVLEGVTTFEEVERITGPLEW